MRGGDRARGTIRRAISHLLTGPRNGNAIGWLFSIMGGFLLLFAADLWLEETRAPRVAPAVPFFGPGGPVDDREGGAMSLPARRRTSIAVLRATGAVLWIVAVAGFVWESFFANT